LRHRAFWALAVILSVTILIAPAIWNGFPLLQYDTGGYLARWYEGTLDPSRAVVYGLILTLGVPLSFWPVLLLQSALTVWVVALILRAHGLGQRPWLMLGVIAALPRWAAGMRLRLASRSTKAAATSATRTATVALWVAAETAMSTIRPIRSVRLSASLRISSR
jgi:hypothetical protein